MSEQFYLARLESGVVERRAEKPTDTPSWVGPYTLDEIWLRLVPWWNPLNLPNIESKEGETSSSHGLKPIDFAAKYDEESKCIILFDFCGYVGTVRTPADLWKALVFQAEHGIGSLRAVSRVPDSYKTSEAELKAQADAILARKRAAAPPAKSNVSLEDLGLA